jgi:hypothetical protein
MLLFFLGMLRKFPLHGLARESDGTERVELVPKDTDNLGCDGMVEKSDGLLRLAAVVLGCRALVQILSGSAP